MLEPLENRTLCAGGPLSGDADLDGIVDIDDYGMLDRGDIRADFNYDGKLNIDDYGEIDFNVGKTITQVTGPYDRSVLVARSSGKWDITQPGTYENFTLDNGWISISAHDVTVRNFVITNPSGTGAAIKFSSNDITGGRVEFGDISGGSVSNGVAGSNYIADRLHIWNMQADAFRVKVNVTISNSYIHDFALAPKAHGDGVQMYPTDGGNMRIIGNRIDARGGNAALFQVNNGWTIERNYLHGGGYTVQCGGELGNKFVNNTFGRDARYGPIRVGSGDKTLLTFVNNIFTDGAAVTL